jgi:NTP pyrophosphatase (non-canonical NTP hydrolase)
MRPGGDMTQQTPEQVFARLVETALELARVCAEGDPGMGLVLRKAKEAAAEPVLQIVYTVNLAHISASVLLVQRDTGEPVGHLFGYEGDLRGLVAN